MANLGLQDWLAFALVAVAAIYVGHRFFLQFNRKEQEPMCSKCAPNHDAHAKKAAADDGPSARFYR